MDNSRYIAKHVINLPKSGIRDFFEIVSKMKERGNFPQWKLSAFTKRLNKVSSSRRPEWAGFSDSAI